MPASVFVLFAIVLGGVAGSHVALIADRLPLGETIASGRSRCRDCRAVLSPAEMVPILSFLLQRGRCRKCGTRLPPDLVIAEIGGAAIAVLALISVASAPAALAVALFGWTLLLLALLDWRHFWLPDRITLPLMLTGLASGILLPGIGPIDRILGAVLGYGSLSAVRIGYRALRGQDGLGEGDAKLLAAIGAWLGASALPAIVLSAALIALIGVALHRLRGGTVTRIDALPFGTPLAVAAVSAIPFVL